MAPTEAMALAISQHLDPDPTTPRQSDGGRVVLAITPTRGGRQVLEWAVVHALRACRTLVLVHSVRDEIEVLCRLEPASREAIIKDCEDRGARLLEDAALLARTSGLTGVRRVLSSLDTDSALVSESHGAALLVLGDDGRRAAPGPALAAARRLHDAGVRCPVAEVGDNVWQRRGARHVLAVIDGTCRSGAILDAAFEEARLHERELTVLVAPDPTSPEWDLVQAGFERQVARVMIDQRRRSSNDRAISVVLEQTSIDRHLACAGSLSDVVVVEDHHVEYLLATVFSDPDNSRNLVTIVLPRDDTVEREAVKAASHAALDDDGSWRF